MGEKINYQELAKSLIPLVGGPENIREAAHCITRLRFILKEVLVNYPAKNHDGCRKP